MIWSSRWQPGGDLRLAASRVFLVGLWIGALTLAGRAAVYYIAGHGVGMDAHAYWLSGRLEHPYGPAPEQRDAYLYSPLFAQTMRLVAWLPWPVFCGMFLAASAAVYCWLASPLPWRWRVPVLLLCVPELLITNIYAFLAASLVLGLTRPALWAFPALTKVTPACVGAAWFVASGQWRRAALAASTTVILSAASFALEPGLWFEWVSFLREHGGQGGIEYPVRLLGALALAWWVARRGPLWLLGVAFYLAMPLAGLGQTLTPLIAIVRLARLSPIDPSSPSEGNATTVDTELVES